MLWGVSPWVYPVWDSLGFLDFSGYSPPHFRGVILLSPQEYSHGLSFVFFLDSFHLNAGAFNSVPEFSEVSSFFKILFFSFFPVYFNYFYHFVFNLTYPTFASFVIMLVPSRVCLISLIALFIIDQFLFMSSRSLLNIFYLFSILVARLFICNSILFSRFFHYF